MSSLLQLAVLLDRGRRMRAYKETRANLEALTEADLADAGIKRYQLGAAARAKALR
jgi:uncharacterized protein YjiS (DUF1127 family)